MKTLILSCVICFVALTCLFGQSEHNCIPPEGYIPDEPTAIGVGRVILERIYGKDNISRQLPLTAKLKSGTWTVVGTLPRNHVGGVALLEIRKDDGKITRVTHGK